MDSSDVLNVLWEMKAGQLKVMDDLSGQIRPLGRISLVALEEPSSSLTQSAIWYDLEATGIYSEACREEWLRLYLQWKRTLIQETMPGEGFAAATKLHAVNVRSQSPRRNFAYQPLMAMVVTE